MAHKPNPSYYEKVERRLREFEAYHLMPIFTSATHIPERLWEMDHNLFIVLNTKRQKFEVHSLANIGYTYGFDLPFRELNDKALEYANKLDLKKHGNKIFREIDEKNEELERRNEKHKQNERDAAARELRPLFKKAADELGV